MALTLERALDVKKRTRMDTRKPGVTENLRALWKHMEALGNPDLQFVPLDYTGGADIVVADVACKLYALYVLKPAASTTDAWIKISDHATTAAANGDVVVKLLGTGGGGRAYCIVFSDGLKLGTGATTASHTTVNGNTDSAAGDSANGFAIIGAA
jgi:hypothetical protein